MMVDVASFLNKNAIKIKDFKVSPEHLAKLVNMVEKGTVSSKQARQLFEKMVSNMHTMHIANLHINMLGVLHIKVLRNMKTKIKQELIV